MQTVDGMMLMTPNRFEQILEDPSIFHVYIQVYYMCNWPILIIHRYRNITVVPEWTTVCIYHRYVYGASRDVHWNGSPTMAGALPIENRKNTNKFLLDFFAFDQSEYSTSGKRAKRIISVFRSNIISFVHW